MYKFLTVAIARDGTKRLVHCDGMNTASVTAGSAPANFSVKGMTYVRYVFPATEADWEALYRHPYKWRPMRERDDGTYVPNRHQRKHGVLSLERGC